MALMANTADSLPTWGSVFRLIREGLGSLVCSRHSDGHFQSAIRQRRCESMTSIFEHWGSLACCGGFCTLQEQRREKQLFIAIYSKDRLSGFAVLIYDRRGSGRSSGNLQSVDYETLADDAVAGQHALAKLPRVDPTKIGFWGLSQGGWLAVLAAGRSRDAAFAISVSAPLVTADEQMQFATSNLLTVRGYSHEDVREMLETRRAWTSYLRGTNSRAAAVDALTKAESKPWFDLTYMPKVSDLTNDPALRRKLDDDPVAAVLKSKVPLLFVYGGSDPWVPVGQSMQRLKTLSNQLHNIESVIIANANHELMFPVNETMQVDADTNRNDAPQSPAYFMLLGSWLSRRFPNR